MIQEESVLLTTVEAAALVGVKVRTWYTWDQLGYIPKPIKIGEKLHWRRRELLDWVDAGCPRREDWYYRPRKEKS